MSFIEYWQALYMPCLIYPRQHMWQICDLCFTEMRTKAQRREVVAQAVSDQPLNQVWWC